MVKQRTSPNLATYAQGKHGESVVHPFHFLRDRLVSDGLFSPDGASEWRVATTLFPLSSKDATLLRDLGTELLKFYTALNRLYIESVRGLQPSWIHAYLDQGKPESLISYARMNRFRNVLPDVIRPDIIPTQNGMVITELDSVPGGLGITGSLSKSYSALDQHVLGGADGMAGGFADMMLGKVTPPSRAVAIVVSDESEAYRPEMKWLAARLWEFGLEAHCVHPKDIRFTEQGLFLTDATDARPIGVVYRFFELFDLKNIPKIELVMYAAKKGRTIVTPPFKPWLEEKLAFALLHHPCLRSFWDKNMGEDAFGLLEQLVPQTWILDPQPIPPSAVIPHLHLDGQAVSDWMALTHASQRERRYVVKPSGFSEFAWGSRGVLVGHDLSQTEWESVLRRALAEFPRTPYVLQEFHSGRPFELSYFDDETGDEVSMEGRARLSPYYFVQGDRAELSGVMATVCPMDKKLIHGMREAVMVPCSIASEKE